MGKLFATTKNGYEVYIDMERSHALTHLSKTSGLEAAAKEFIAGIGVCGDQLRLEKDMGYVVGFVDLVETKTGDDIVYAKRPHRETYSRFVKNKKSAPSSWVTLDLRRKGDLYELYTAFVGRLTPSFPGGDFLPDQSKDFWSRHALVWGSQEIVPGTETKECPW
jgi:hypothetical protein